jgi:hypothetical protein
MTRVNGVAREVLFWHKGRTGASAWLWQFTGDGIGPKPHSIPGIVGSGDAVKLAAEWSGPTSVEPPTA